MAPRRTPSPADEAIAEQAAQWLIELDESTPGELAEFAAWLGKSPRHVEEFLLAQAVWNAFDGFDAQRRIDVAALLQSAADNVRRLPLEVSAHAPRSSVGPRWRMAAVAAAAIFLVAATLLMLFPWRAGVYETAVGEQRAFKLEDGSIVSLNTQSRIEVHYSDGARMVRLLAGEALFSVERDPDRPFRVVADRAVIQAIGTQFNVRRSAEATTVSVVEGVVQISPTASVQTRPAAGSGGVPMQPVKPAPVARLAAGERARVTRGGEIVTEVVPDVARMVAWRERRLVFRGDPLENVAAEFNRYNDTQIRIEGEATRAKRLTGVFDADDPHALLLFLEHDESLSVETSGGAVVIRGP